MATQGPAQSGLVKNLGIANQAVDMGFSKKVSGRCDKEYVGIFLIEWQANFNASFFLDIFFQTV